MSRAPFVDVRREGAACVLTLRREEKLNALSTAVEGELADALTDPLVEDSACVVITGGARVFSAGADVTEFRDRDPAAVLAYYRLTGGVYEQVAALPQPVIAAIAGYCLGGGFELALACDFRIAETSAAFQLPEVGLGIIPSSGGVVRLVQLIGAARAKELVLLPGRVSAERAHGLGLVTEVVPEGRSLGRALELAERIAALPQTAVRVAKQAIDRMPGTSHAGGLAIERLAYALLAQSDDARAGAEAFTSKGTPRSKGD